MGHNAIAAPRGHALAGDFERAAPSTESYNYNAATPRS